MTTNAQPEKIDSRNYFYFSNFTEHYEILSKIPEGPLSEENQTLLAAIIDDVDTGVGSGQWRVDSPTNEWGFQNVSIVYNGPNAQRLPTNRRLDFALGMVFPNESIVPTGVVYITYSAPEQ